MIGHPGGTKSLPQQSPYLLSLEKESLSLWSFILEEHFRLFLRCWHITVKSHFGSCNLNRTHVKKKGDSKNLPIVGVGFYLHTAPLWLFVHQIHDFPIVKISIWHGSKIK